MYIYVKQQCVLILEAKRKTKKNSRKNLLLKSLIMRHIQYNRKLISYLHFFTFKSSDIIYNFMTIEKYLLYKFLEIEFLKLLVG